MTAQTPNSVGVRSISMAAAAVATQAAVAHAEQLGIRINVAVTDGGGTLMAFLRMPAGFFTLRRDCHAQGLSRRQFWFSNGAMAHHFAR